MAEGYSETTLDHYESPRNRGLLNDFNARASRTNPVCGDSLALTLRIRGGTIEAAGFEVTGCVAATAGASVMTELVIGKTPSDATRLTADEIESALDGLPPGRAHGATLAADTLTAALADYSA
ncbi:MAG TPA: iron-sulfur cluster assembly scaffold protein [Dehalococcoidia bacterium]|nr:iron-sulfur cluster assembly scaffold protein [Dehalococcoidia bacterium]